MPLFAGDLDRLVGLYQPTPTTLSNGGFAPTLTHVKDVWASKRDFGGRAGAMSGREAAVRETIFEIRFRTDVADHWVVRYRNEDFEVQRVEEIGRREGLRLYGKKKAQ